VYRGRERTGRPPATFKDAKLVAGKQHSAAGR